MEPVTSWFFSRIVYLFFTDFLDKFYQRFVYFAYVFDILILDFSDFAVGFSSPFHWSLSGFLTLPFDFIVSLFSTLSWPAPFDL